MPVQEFAAAEISAPVAAKMSRRVAFINAS
jgi:hypothetical protein